MNRLSLILVFVLASCATTPPTSDLRWKADDHLYEVVQRFAAAEIDTTVAIEAELRQTITDARRAELIKECELKVLDRFDSTAMMVAPSKSLPCLAKQAEFKTFRMVPAWSPDL